MSNNWTCLEWVWGSPKEMPVPPSPDDMPGKRRHERGGSGSIQGRWKSSAMPVAASAGPVAASPEKMPALGGVTN